MSQFATLAGASIDPATLASPAQVAVAVAVLLAALVALFGSRRLLAVVGLLVFGTLLSVLWGLIGAPDVALAEAAIGTGVTGALFVATVTALGRDTRVDRTSVLAVSASVVAGASLGLLIGWTLTSASVAPGLTDDIARALPETGVENPVTGVLLNLRSFDTLMEMVVLLAAAAITLAFFGAGDRTGGESADSPLPRTPILSGFARLSAPVLILLTSWLLIAGTSRPGGAFQAGAALAALLVVLHLTGILRLRPGRGMRAALAVGLLAFLMVAALGPLGGQAWLQLRGAAAAPVTIALETILMATIGASLATLFLAAFSPRSGASGPEESV